MVGRYKEKCNSEYAISACAAAAARRDPEGNNFQCIIIIYGFIGAPGHGTPRAAGRSVRDAPSYLVSGIVACHFGNTHVPILLG
ncbi:hypothetical protein EVAR_82457_1 [Eumeta japonica]|uniref:Uncharacterized protein n=1 Tax=Eumeta variegata TaxID=151549 RepID=A0A4C1X5P3_EUMVA|nr:hypothetical protein EVAR_82457_1 [Eumeta japonica]